jgi:hypothetical protein
MMPILAARGDLDPSEMDSTMIDLMNISGLPEGEYKRVWDDRKNNKYSSNLEAIRAAFRWLNHRKESAESKRYADIIPPPDILMPVSSPDIYVDELVADVAPQTEFDDLMEDILVDAAQPAPLGISMVQEEMSV